MDAPPIGEIYRVAEFKRELAAGAGIDAGIAAFIGAYPDERFESAAVPLRSLRDYARASGLAYHELAPAGEPFVSRAPRVVGDGDARDFYGRSRALFVAALGDVRIMSRSYIVRTHDAALADFQDDERERGGDRPELDPQLFAVERGLAYVLEPRDASVLEIPEAFVSLVGPHSDAFGHWIWHQIPRFVAALESGMLPEMPVLVDRDMPPSHFEALALAVGSRAMPIVTVPPGTIVRVGRAWYASGLFHVPYLPVNDVRWTWSHIATPPGRYTVPLAAMALSARALGGVGRGERIYLARRPHLRRCLTNASEIEDIARARGFAIVFPEELTFEDQLRIVRDARYVVGPEGSAMFGTFYARPGLRIAILDHPFVEQLTNYTAPLAASGADVTLFTGTVVRANDTPGYPNFGFKHFADYSIDGAHFEAFLKDWCPGAIA